jgi:hypothetical protein
MEKLFVAAERVSKGRSSCQSLTLRTNDKSSPDLSSRLEPAYSADDRPYLEGLVPVDEGRV